MEGDCTIVTSGMCRGFIIPIWTVAIRHLGLEGAVAALDVDEEVDCMEVEGIGGVEIERKEPEVPGVAVVSALESPRLPSLDLLQSTPPVPTIASASLSTDSVEFLLEKAPENDFLLAK